MSFTWSLEGFFDHDIFRNEQTGQGMFCFCTSKEFILQQEVSERSFIRKDTITGKEEMWSYIVCDSTKAPYPYLEKGTPLIIEGNFERGKDNKWVFKVSELKIETKGDYALIKFLSSNAFPEMSYQKAVNFCKYLNKNHLSFSDFLKQGNAAEQFANVCKLNRTEAERIIRSAVNLKEEERVFHLLSAYHVPYPYAVKAVKKLGKNASIKLQMQPFANFPKVGLPVDIADRVAIRNGVFSPINPHRIVSVGKSALDQIYSNGNTFTSRYYFDKIMKKTSRKATEDGLIDSEVAKRATECGIMFERVLDSNGEQKEIIFGKNMFDAEEKAVLNIKRLSASQKKFPFHNDMVDEIMEECNIHYGAQQRNAFETLLRSSGIKILTGGPGTGKTTTVKGIIMAYQKMFPEHKVSLCAPTGRAAQRMAESTEMPACTVHRLINYVPYGDNSVSVKNQNDPLEADLVVCDEASMLDMELFSYLLDAVKTGGTIIFMGDTHQLSSVGPGSVLQDISDTLAEYIQKANLTEVFRQKGGSPIIDNSIRINEGNVNLASHRDFEIIRTQNAEETLSVMKSLVKKYHDPKNPFSTQILCPSKSGTSGVNNQNIVFQDILNPSKGSKNRILYGRGEFRIGDKIIMMKNNYEADYMNGDIGVITKIDEKRQMHVQIRGKDYTITRDMLEDIKLAYGMTIHKSQGSEFQTAIVVMPENPANMLTRNLFYTGVTRAKKRCIVISEGSSMEKAIRTDRGPCERRSTFSLILLRNNMLTKKGAKRVLDSIA